jgi:Mg-chelatase subunit ChlI
MATAETTAAELLEQGLRPVRAHERMREALLGEIRRLEQEDGLDRTAAVQALFDDVVLEQETLEVLVTSLLAGSNVLVLGPPGSGKTSLAKAVWELFPKDRFAVADCPVHDDPFSLIDPAFARQVPPCPYCKANHGDVEFGELGDFEPEDVDPEDVPVKQVTLREGYGFARVQGSPEVFPDNLTGTVNLSRLEEVGDPTSPLVLEPGKILQAHRGVLLVDEVGKLPRGTQNVLLQALQEATCSPAKSRETFPADVLAVTTSNYADLGNITEPLNDRVSNVHTPFPSSSGANRRIVEASLDGAQASVHIPGPYRDAAVRLVMRWRDRVEGGRDLSEVGSNRTLIDIVRRTRSYALMAGDPIADPEDFHRGARDAMTGRIRARSGDGFEENRELVERFVEEHWRTAGREGAVDYWCRFFRDELGGDEQRGQAVARALREARELEPSDLQRRLREDGDEHLRAFGRYVQREEDVDREGAARVLPGVADALEAFDAFEADG